MTDTRQKTLSPPVYIVHERFYITNISQIPFPAYTQDYYSTHNIIYTARGPRVLYEVFTLYRGTTGIVDTLHKIADNLWPGKHEPWTPAYKFSVRPSNLAKQKMVSRDKLVNIPYQTYCHMDIPSPCLTLYEMPNDFNMPNPNTDNIISMAKITDAMHIYNLIHEKCTNMLPIVYYKQDYKLYISDIIMITYLEKLILNKYYLCKDPLYKWIRNWRDLFFLYLQCKHIKVGSSRLNYSSEELADKYREYKGREPKWYHKMFPNWLMADTCRREMQIDRYDALIQHAETRSSRPTTLYEPIHKVQSTLV